MSASLASLLPFGAWFKNQAAATAILQAALQDSSLAAYNNQGARQAGDIFIHINKDTQEPDHANLTSPDLTRKVDSVPARGGIRLMPIKRDKHTAMVYRFHDKGVALRAAQLAESWAEHVGYSDITNPVAVRGLITGFGPSNFGRGAHARLLKYRSRVGLTPKNVTCAEMCILAYQLSMSESDTGFIRLDAKYSSPARLILYMENEGKAHWKRVAILHGTE